MGKILTHKQFSAKGGKSTAKKLGKKGLSLKGKMMAEAKKQKNERTKNLYNLQETIYTKATTEGRSMQ